MCNDLFPGYRRAFQKLPRQTRGNHAEEEVVFGLRSAKGDWLAQLTMRWMTQDGRRVAYLIALDDNWIILPQFRAIYARLATLSGHLITPERFMLVLAEKGFKDCTDYEASLVKPGIEQLFEDLERLLAEMRRRFGRSA